MKAKQRGVMLLDVLAALFVASLSIVLISNSMSYILNRIAVSAAKTQMALASPYILEQIDIAGAKVQSGVVDAINWSAHKECGKHNGGQVICEIQVKLTSGRVTQVLTTFAY